MQRPHVGFGREAPHRIIRSVHHRPAHRAADRDRSQASVNAAPDDKNITGRTVTPVSRAPQQEEIR